MNSLIALMTLQPAPLLSAEEQAEIQPRYSRDTAEIQPAPLLSAEEQAERQYELAAMQPVQEAAPPEGQLGKCDGRWAASLRGMVGGAELSHALANCMLMTAGGRRACAAWSAAPSGTHEASAPRVPPPCPVHRAASPHS